MIKDFNDKEFAPNEVALFNEQYLAAFRKLADAVKAKKKLEQDEKALKEQLQKAMDEFGIKSIDNEYIKITRVAGGKDSVTVDLKAFQEKEPNNYKELLADYPKTVKGRSGYVKFEVKGCE